MTGFGNHELVLDGVAYKQLSMLQNVIHWSLHWDLHSGAWCVLLESFLQSFLKGPHFFVHLKKIVYVYTVMAASHGNDRAVKLGECKAGKGFIEEKLLIPEDGDGHLLSQVNATCGVRAIVHPGNDTGLCNIDG